MSSILDKVRLVIFIEEFLKRYTFIKTSNSSRRVYQLSFWSDGANPFILHLSQRFLSVHKVFILG